nr:Chain A, CDP-1 peptide, Cysteine Deleted Protegrin-1 [unidentified]
RGGRLYRRRFVVGR